MADEKRIVITGVGCLSPFGPGVDTLWSNLVEEKSAAGKITYFDTGNFKVKIACEIKDFNPADYLDEKSAKNYDRNILYSMFAADQAISDSGDLNGYYDDNRIGVIHGSGVGGLSSLEEQYEILYTRGKKAPRRISPLIVPNMITNMSAGTIALQHNFHGLNFSVSSACATASHAMAVSFEYLKLGMADAIICGGGEAAITKMGIAGFTNMKALSKKRNDDPRAASRPFDNDRDGFVMGEGAGAFVLETLKNARKRGAKIYAEVLGYGMTDDAYHVAAPDPDGKQTSRCMELTLQKSGLNRDEVDYINTHGTATPLGDIAEIRAVKKAFGKDAENIKINSTKSQIGHLLGAAGAVELSAVIKSIQKNFIPRSINIEERDPECDLNILDKEGYSGEVKTALSNSFGFGGHNCTIALGEYK